MNDTFSSYEAWAKQPHDQRQEHYDYAWGGYDNPLAQEAYEFHRQESENDWAEMQRGESQNMKAMNYGALFVLGDEPQEDSWHSVYERYEDSDFRVPSSNSGGNNEVSTVDDIPF